MNKLYRTPVVVSIVMLFLALFDLPGGYYALLRIIVCGTAIYLGFIAKEITKMSWVWTLGFLAILFNPFLPIHLDREMWAFIDVFVALAFITGIFALSGEGATKSFFQTKAFKVFTKVGLIIIGCSIVVVFVKLVNSEKRENIKKKSTQIDFTSAVDVVEKESKQFDLKTARPTDGYFIETYPKQTLTLDKFLEEGEKDQSKKGEITLIGSYRNGKADDVWKIYDEYGNLRAEQKYDKGVLVDEVKVFDENEQLKSKYPCSKGVIVGSIDPQDADYVTYYDGTTREAMSLEKIDYEDEDLKVKLLPPYFLALDSKKYLFFEIKVEVINKTKIINNSSFLPLVNSNAYLKDNFGNAFICSSIQTPLMKWDSEIVHYLSSKNTSPNKDLRFGDIAKIIFYTDDEPLKNSIYFHLELYRGDSFSGTKTINFIFPAYYINQNKVE